MVQPLAQPISMPPMELDQTSSFETMASPLHESMLMEGHRSSNADGEVRRRPITTTVPASANANAAVTVGDRPEQLSQRQRQRKQRHRQQRQRQWPSLTRMAALSLLVAQPFLLSLTLSLLPACVSGHGYLMTPRARNLVAYQDKDYEHPDGNDPKPEDCPHCLNRGGNKAQCGIMFGTHNNEPWERNYDQPMNIQGGHMRPNLQGVYREGAVLDVEFLITTHHKGHVEIAACAIDSTQIPMPIPTAECFEENKLTFLSDELYGAPQDPNYPERAYIAPASKVDYMEPMPGVQPVVGAEYKMKFQLPDGLAGNLVLLQWYYLTANSCKHEGYAEYPFPEEWGSDTALYPGLPDCGPVPPDGAGVPEQFWNCAEIRIVGQGKATRPLSSPTPPGAMISMNAPGNSGSAPGNSGSAPGNGAPAPRTPRPTSSPTPFTPCQKNPSAIYYEATEDCSGYYICQSGTQGQVYQCAGWQMLYDEANQRCDWATEVTCGPPPVESPYDEDGNPRPTPEPTPEPTGKPNELLAWTPTPRLHDKTIIAYYASWQWYDRNGIAEPKNFDWSKITRANFAFFQITETGYIYGTDMWADPITLFGFYDWMAEEGTARQYCSWDEPNTEPNCMAHKYEEGLIYLAHQAGAEVYPSIGGWSLSDPFPVMAANRESRENFARQCIKLIKEYNFDGIDLDWEYPGYEPHSGTPEDRESFNLLLDTVRAALDELGTETGRFYGLTAALPCGPSIIDNQDIAHVGRLLTELNLMTYDFHGSWNEKTGVNAPLYDQNDSPEFSVHGCVENWLEGGAPREKINIGFPFYGRSFLNAEHLYEDHEGGDETMWWMDEGVPQYYNIMDKFDEYEHVRDEQTMTQYMFGSTGMVSYDDERAICDKTEYAQVHDLNGYIIWEISGDLMPDLSTPLLDAANAKLLNPDMDCAGLDLSTYIAEAIDGVFAGVSLDGVGGGDGGGGGVGGAPAAVFYPDHSQGECKSDGEQSDWLQSTDLFNNLEDCCDHHFNWKKEMCVDESPETPAPVVPDVAEKADSLVADDSSSNGLIYYPSSMGHVCLSDGNQPSWLTVGSMFDNEEDCCEEHFPGEDCTSEIFEHMSMMYYPASAGSMCLSDGNQPTWLAESSMFDNEEDCCDHHFPSQDCVGKTLPDPTKIPTRSPTPKPTRPTPKPTPEPISTPEPTESPTSRPTPRPTRSTPRPSSKTPTPRPTRSTPRPSSKTPTPRPTPSTPRPTPRLTPMPILQDSVQSLSALKPDPTRRPTRQPQPRPTRRPTPRPANPAQSYFGDTPIASSFTGQSPFASSFMNRPTPNFALKPPNDNRPSSIDDESKQQQPQPSKGQEQQQLGLNIKNQIQQQMANTNNNQSTEKNTKNKRNKTAKRKQKKRQKKRAKNKRIKDRAIRDREDR